VLKLLVIIKDLLLADHFWTVFRKYGGHSGKEQDQENQKNEGFAKFPEHGSPPFDKTETFV
jgi:hypothetical protein